MRPICCDLLNISLLSLEISDHKVVIVFKVNKKE